MKLSSFILNIGKNYKNMEQSSDLNYNQSMPYFG